MNTLLFYLFTLSLSQFIIIIIIIIIIFMVLVMMVFPNKLALSVLCK